MVPPGVSDNRLFGDAGGNDAEERPFTPEAEETSRGAGVDGARDARCEFGVAGGWPSSAKARALPVTAIN